MLSEGGKLGVEGSAETSGAGSGEALKLSILLEASESFDPVSGTSSGTEIFGCTCAVPFSDANPLIDSGCSRWAGGNMA